MTQDEIIRMAREAGFINLALEPKITRFAAIVAAHEREKQKTKTMRKATRDEKIVRPGVYEVQVEQSSQQPVGVYYGEVEGIGHRIRLDVELPIGAKLYAAPVRTKDLTDKEIRKLWSDAELDITWFARAVIAADREKNK